MTAPTRLITQWIVMGTDNIGKPTPPPKRKDRDTKPNKAKAKAARRAKRKSAKQG